MSQSAAFDVLIVAIPATIAAGAAVYGARLAQSARVASVENQEKLETGNEKDIGTTVHDIAQTVEAISSQGLRNAHNIRAVHDELVMWKAESRALRERMEQHLDERDE